MPGFEPLSVPRDLTESEAEVWRGLVTSKPADYFGPEHIPVMVEYARAVCRGHVIDQQIRAFDPVALEDNEGLRRYDRLVGMSCKNALVVKTLATTMRITQQAILRADKASLGSGKGRKPWVRDQ